MRLFAGYDGRADIWSVGVILYELLTFTRPFQGDNIAQLAMAIARKQPKELPANTPQDLVELTARCLKKDKTTRPSASELLHTEPMLTWARQQTEASRDADATPDAPRAVRAGTAEPTPPAVLAATTDVPPSQLAAPTDTVAPLAASTSSAAPPSEASESAGERGERGPLAANGELSLDFTCAITPPGLRQLFQWRAHAQQSGGGNASDPLWQSVDALVGQEVVAMSAGRHATAVVSASGALYSWRAPGSDTEAVFAKTSRPARLEAASALHVTAAAMGDEMLLLLEEGGQL